MARLAKFFVLTLLGLNLLASAHAFSLLGPYLTSWQVQAIGYNLPFDIGGPRDKTSFYRWNVPRLTYAFDASFDSYFGQAGRQAVENAIAVLNALPPASQMGTLTDFPFDTKRPNYEAEQLGLLDLKSTALSVLLEEMGLANPERYTWTLRGRLVLTNPNVTNYTVIVRNYDPLSQLSSPYVNGVLYGYQVLDPILPLNYASAIEINRVDPTLIPYSSVAGAVGSFDDEALVLPDGTFDQNGQLLSSGKFVTGLTYDDAGGLKFLLSPNTVAPENLLADVVAGLEPCPYCPFGFTNLATNAIVRGALRGGVDKIEFVRVEYDSLLGQITSPYTNAWTDKYHAFTNGHYELTEQNVQRVLTRPDILFSAQDVGFRPNSFLPFILVRTGTAAWQAATTPVAEPPGTIAPPANASVNIIFSSLFPYFISTSPGGVDPFSSQPGITWGSFDGSTNAPTVFNATLDQLRSWVLP